MSLVAKHAWTITQLRKQQNSLTAWTIGLLSCAGVAAFCWGFPLTPKEKTIVGLLGTTAAGAAVATAHKLDRLSQDGEPIEQQAQRIRTASDEAQAGAFGLQLKSRLQDLAGVNQQVAANPAPEWHDQTCVAIERVFRKAAIPVEVVGVEAPSNTDETWYILRRLNPNTKLGEFVSRGNDVEFQRELTLEAGLCRGRVGILPNKLFLAVPKQTDELIQQAFQKLTRVYAKDPAMVAVDEPTAAPEPSISFTIPGTGSPVPQSIDNESAEFVPIQSQAIRWDKPQQSMFPVEDVAQLIAQTTIDPSNASSVFIVAPRRCGKSNLLRASIAATHAAWRGRADFYVFAGKEGETYCGLEKDSDRYIYSGDRVLAKQVADRMENINGERIPHAVGFPTIIVNEELNNTLQAAKVYDMLESGGKIEKRIKAYNYERVTKGAGKLVVDWITTHAPRVEDVGFNTGIQQSLKVAIVGRNRNYAAIREALIGAKNALIDDDEIRQTLLAQFKEYQASDIDHAAQVLCLTNLGDRWRLCILPSYPDHQPEIIASNFAPPSPKPDAFDAWDKFAEEKLGIPDVDSELEKRERQIQSTPVSLDQIISSIAQIVADLQSWTNTLGRLPTDAELKSQIDWAYRLQEQGLTLSEEAFYAIKAQLTQP